jgi:hypothetical protein
MRQARKVACMGKSRYAYRVLVGKPEGKRPLGREGADGRVILRWMFRKWNVGGAQVRYWWRAFVNAVTNLWVH